MFRVLTKDSWDIITCGTRRFWTNLECITREHSHEASRFNATWCGNATWYHIHTNTSACIPKETKENPQGYGYIYLSDRIIIYRIIAERGDACEFMCHVHPQNLEVLKELGVNGSPPWKQWAQENKEILGWKRGFYHPHQWNFTMYYAYARGSYKILWVHCE